jgi:AraC-like DNA-binding protein
MPRLNDSRIGTLLGDRYGVRASTWTSSTPHAQHGAALFVTLEAEMTVTNSHGDVARGRVLIVPPDLENSVHSAGPVIGICYDPERVPRVTARSRCRGGAYALDGRLARMLVEQATAYRAHLDRGDVLAGIADEAATSIGRHTETPSPCRIDSRVAAVAEALRADSALVTEIAPRLAISRAHLADLFVRDIGVPIRSYRLWRRLLRAILAFASSDATTAAHRAGFADLAHFSRTCRRMLGYTPTALREGVARRDV